MNTVRTAPTLARPDGGAPLAERLRRRLLALDYPAFARCVCALLEALGYEEARPAGRQEWKGYNRAGGGGYDLEASLPGGLAPRRVVAQIKQYDALAVHQRSVDELRGACLRAGATEALLVTTSAFSDVVRRHAASPDPIGTLVAPVRLIDGEELLALLIRHRLGVRERVLGGTRRLGVNLLEIDDVFFAILGAPPVRMPDAGVPAPRMKPGRPQWRVTIRISSAACPRTRNAVQEENRRGKDDAGTKDDAEKGGR